MKQFSKVKAVFNPKKTSDLRPELVPLIGETIEFMYAWTMDQGDPFPGVWALTTRDTRFSYWVPEFDLEVIEEKATFIGIGEK